MTHQVLELIYPAMAIVKKNYSNISEIVGKLSCFVQHLKGVIYFSLKSFSLCLDLEQEPGTVFVFYNQCWAVNWEFCMSVGAGKNLSADNHVSGIHRF